MGGPSILRRRGAGGGRLRRPRAMAIEQEHLDRYLVLAYAMSCAAVVVLLPSGHVRSWLQAGIAFALQIVVGLLLVFEPRLEHGRYRWLGVAGIAASLTSVALLRDATAPASGFGTLVLLPLVWAALGVRRR